MSLGIKTLSASCATLKMRMVRGGQAETQNRKVTANMDLSQMLLPTDISGRRNVTRAIEAMAMRTAHI
jgi:hypothetical protein